jgi:ATP-dependent Lon protease
LEKVKQFRTPAKPQYISVLQMNMPLSHKAVLMDKIDELNSMHQDGSEYTKQKRWVDGFMRIPHGVYSPPPITFIPGTNDLELKNFMANARSTLDKCTYGMESSKIQMMTLLSNMITNPTSAGKVIAFQGPMGTGKTTLIKEGLSRILNRECAMIALGGATGASFLEGHEYTYEGAKWGQIAQILMTTKTMNPVIFFDELDKVSETAHGQEITNVLVHLTDPSQNNEFRDKYFSEVTLSLDQCTFIFSYNDHSKVNKILADRLTVINTAGYTTAEKMVIARDYLIPSVTKQIGFDASNVIIPDVVLNEIITNPRYGGDMSGRQEEGVRQLRRTIETIYSKLNLVRLSGSELFRKEIDLGTGDIVFPFTVSINNLNALVKRKNHENQSHLAMYT